MLSAHRWFHLRVEQWQNHSRLPYNRLTMQIMFRLVFSVIRLQVPFDECEALVHSWCSPDPSYGRAPSTHPVPLYVAPAASAVLRIHVSTSFVPRNITVWSFCAVIFCDISRCSSPSRHRVHDVISVICGTSPYGLHTHAAQNDISSRLLMYKDRTIRSQGALFRLLYCHCGANDMLTMS